MSMPGWYPDPAGNPGHFRYWNGSTWSQQTTTTPQSTPAPPDPAGPGGVPPTPHRRGRGPLVAAITAIVLLALTLTWFLNRSGTTASAPEDTNTSTPTISAWNETSTPTPSKNPSSEQAPSQAVLTDCPVAPLMSLDHPDDGRLHGGHISVERLGDGWYDDESGFVSWAVDSSGQMKPIVDSWVSNSAVGGLLKSDGFTDPHRSALAFMSCYASSSYYNGFTGRKDLTSQKMTIDGHSAWWLRSEIRVDFDDPSVQGDIVDLIVVDTGDPTMLSYWEGNATIGDDAVQQEIDQVRSTVRVDS